MIAPEKDWNAIGQSIEIAIFSAVLTILAIILYNVFASPYKMWKEEKDDNAKSLAKSDNLQIGFYSKQVGFLYKDLFQNWNPEGIDANMLIGTPRAFKAFKYLEDLSPSLLLKKDTRQNLDKFLNFFLINRTIFASTFPTIKTIFEDKKSMLKKRGEIEKLAEKLTKDLANVAKPKQEE